MNWTAAVITAFAIMQLISLTPEAMAQQVDWLRPVQVPDSRLNPASPPKIRLGRNLFFDPVLSGGNDVSCATCHQPDHFWADPAGRSLGVAGQRRPRRTPVLQDLAWSRYFAWDGRVDSLEGFILGPVAHPDEMAQDLDFLVAELAGTEAYPDLFEKAFPGEGITLGGVSLSIAAFLRTLRTGPAPFDHWLAGDETAMTPQAIQGFALFTGRAGCMNCHMGWRFTDNGFHNIGTAAGAPGRGRFDPANRAMAGAFKTPGLRNVAARGSFMHDGSMTSLRQVLDHYDCDCDMVPSAEAAWTVPLSENDKLKLIAFLESLNERQSSYSSGQGFTEGYQGQ